MTGRRATPRIGLIPARAGSVGLKSKNTRPLAGLPLYEHTLQAALDAGLDAVHISTDIESILSRRFPEPVRVWPRDPGLAGSATPMAEVVARFIAEAKLHDEIVVLLQPTSPLRSGRHIDEALRQFESTGGSLLMSVVEVDRKVLKYGYLADGRFHPFEDARFLYANRQTLPPAARPNGAIYIFRAGDFVRAQGFPSQRIGAFLMSEEDSMDVDTEAELQACEQALARRRERA